MGVAFGEEADYWREQMRYWLNLTRGRYVDAWSAYVGGWTPCIHCERRNKWVSRNYRNTIKKHLKI